MATAWTVAVEMNVDYWEGFQLTPTGPYEVEMVSAEPYAEKAGDKASSIVIETKIVGGPHGEKYKGKSITVYLGTDVAKEGVRRQWLSFGLSLGMNSEKIGGKLINFSDATLKDKDSGKPRRGFVLVQNPPKNADGTMAGNRTDRRFISAEHYGKLKDQKWPDDVEGVRLAPRAATSPNGPAPSGSDFQVQGVTAPAAQPPAVQQPKPPPPAAPSASDGF